MAAVVSPDKNGNYRWDFKIGDEVPLGYVSTGYCSSRQVQGVYYGHNESFHVFYRLEGNNVIEHRALSRIPRWYGDDEEGPFTPFVDAWQQGIVPIVNTVTRSIRDELIAKRDVKTS